MINTSIITNNVQRKISEINALLDIIKQEVTDFEISTKCRIRDIEYAAPYNQALSDFRLIKTTLAPYLNAFINNDEVDQVLFNQSKELANEYFNIIRIDRNPNSERAREIDAQIINNELGYVLFRIEMAKLEFNRAQHIFLTERPNLIELAKSINSSYIESLKQTDSRDIDLTANTLSLNWIDSDSSEVDLEEFASLRLQANTLDWIDSESSEVDLEGAASLRLQTNTLVWLDSDSSDIDNNNDLLFSSKIGANTKSTTFNFEDFEDSSSDDDNANNWIKKPY